MLKKLPGIAALMLALLPFAALAAPKAPNTTGDDSRVETMLTTWDDYYFYAAFRIHDANVIGTNNTTTSQPQQDDDVEVFFDTEDGHAKLRTPQTYQMAVSAAQGAYFSVGDGTKIPKGKAIYSYKYAVTVHGKLNKADSSDQGYDVELALPWSEMGLSGPPKAGATWGFNVISRDRDSADQLADRFYSLSPKVHKGEDVQNPSKWTRITFAAAGEGTASTAEKVVCAKVAVTFPRINGTIVSGDWPAATRLAFGTEAITAPAPTMAEEPNATESPFDNPPPLGIAPPPPTTEAAVPTDLIVGPNGLVIKVVPHGIAHPIGTEPFIPPPPPPPPIKHQRGDGGSVKVTQNPSIPEGPPVNSGAFVLGQPRPPAFIMAIYRLDYNADTRKGPGQNVWNAQGGTLLADQPVNGTGPWFSGLRTQWHRQQLTDLRRSGIEVALLRTRADDPLLTREIDAFVEALKEMKAQGMDYPLVGVDATAGQPDLDVIYAHVPPEFRAMQELPSQTANGVLVYDLSFGADAKSALADGTPIARVYYNDGVASVSPGRVDRNGVISRNGGRTYDTSWQVAMVSTPPQVVVDSWNDFSHGTEIAASRQYGEQYADTTKAQTLQFDGNRQWHAKYLAEAVPRVVYPKTLYQVPIRIENAGSLPWRAGEGYSLNTRWYKNGKLFDDSAPRVPIGKDVLPGEALTLSVGLVARDNFGEDLEPGNYTLVVDMVQGPDRWFSYAGDSPLQVAVTVASEVGSPLATFLSTQTPGVAQAGTNLATVVKVRNDSASSWPTSYALGYKLQTVDPDGSNPKTVAEGSGPMGSDPVTPGQIASVSLTIPTAASSGKPLSSGEYRLHWFIKADALGTAVTGNYDEPLSVADSLPGASFIIADLPRTVDAGKEETAHLALINLGTQTWKKKDVKIGYHWYYLDGAEREWEGGPTAPLTKDLAAGKTDGTIDAVFHTPKQAGRYALVWDVRQGDQPWQSTLPLSVGNDLLQYFVTVTGKNAVVPVDLTKAFNTLGISSGETSKTGGFDGHGAVLPAELMPPDGTSETEGIPFLSGKPGPPLYPSGDYTAQIGTGAASNHALPFLYPSVREGLPNVVSCTGQTIALPGGKYKALHLLTAAGSNSPVTASFGLQYDREMQSQPLTISSWNVMPAGIGVTPAYTVPYRYTANGIKPLPITLGDYTLPLNTGKKLTGLTLPDEPAIKIVSVTLEKE